MADLTFAKVSALLEADFGEGRLFWLPRKPELFRTTRRTADHNCSIWNSKNAGKEAFTTVGFWGYKQGRIFGRDYFAHRVMWLLAYGEWPSGQIDHIDGCRTNNCIDNLRVVSNSQNHKNRRMSPKNTSG